MMRVIIAAFCGYVGFAGDGFQTLYSLSFLGVETIQVGLIIVRMVPDGCWRIDCCVYKELMVVLWIICPYPALWQRPAFIFHTATRKRWDAITDFEV